MRKEEGIVPTLSVLFALDVRFRAAEKSRSDELNSKQYRLTNRKEIRLKCEK